jgi:DMSO/TMAO reductase YedYZ heme-binding membrane subunit
MSAVIKDVQIMKDVFFAVTIFHSLAAVALFSMMAVTVVNMVNRRIQPRG